MVVVGPISVDSAHNKVPTQQGQYSCRRSKSESTPNAEEPNQGQEAIAQEDVLLLSDNSLEPQSKDLKKWKKAYQEDSKLRIVWQKLRQDNNVKDNFWLY